MISTTIKQLATEIATLRGESLALECSPEESPFPDIEDQVRILAPVALTNLILEAETVDPFDAIPLKAPNLLKLMPAWSPSNFRKISCVSPM